MKMSATEYARYRGISHVAVYKAIRTGRITVESDGLIESSLADVQWRRNTNQAKQNIYQQDLWGRSNTRPDDDSSGSGPSDSSSGVDASSDVSFMRAKTANEVLKVQASKLRLKQMKGELVDKERATRHVFSLARAERDAWLNWPGRIFTQMAIDLGVNAGDLHIVLERYVRSHLDDLSEVNVNFQ